LGGLPINKKVKSKNMKSFSDTKLKLYLGSGISLAASTSDTDALIKCLKINLNLKTPMVVTGKGHVHFLGALLGCKVPYLNEVNNRLYCGEWGYVGYVETPRHYET
jgi:hypothetical protein